MSTPGNNYVRYEVITQEDPESGDLFIPIPLEALEKLGWKEGDEVDFSLDQDGRMVIKKLNK